MTEVDYDAGIIYGITHPNTGQIVYIGQTTGNLVARFAQHLDRAHRAKKPNAMQTWLKQWPIDNLPGVKVLLTCPSNTLNYWEHYFWDALRPPLNAHTPTYTISTGRLCPVCNTLKAFDDFYNTPQSRCKSCQTKRQRQYYNTKKD